MKCSCGSDDEDEISLLLWKTIFLATYCDQMEDCFNRVLRSVENTKCYTFWEERKMWCEKTRKYRQNNERKHVEGKG